MNNICTVDNCESVATRRGWCKKHYVRWQRHGDPTFTKVEMHGMYGHPLYAVWISMKNRCRNPNEKFYYLYGGRGIRVCDRWYTSFVAFLEDMGPRPTGYTIERRDNDGDYEPSNCYWATPKEQAKNRRLTRDSLGRWKSLTGKRGYNYQPN